MTTPSVSIISVCLNEAPERIRTTLDSILEQQDVKLELIVIDGGSKEDTLAALRTYQCRMRTMLSEPDRGLYDAMNKGLRLASGDWILFMNIGDRFSAPDVLRTMLAAAGDHAEILIGDMRCNGKEFYPTYPRFSWLSYYPGKRFVCNQAMLTRRNVFRTVGDFNLAYATLADFDWFHRCLRAGIAISHVNIVVCDWEAGGVSSDKESAREQIRRIENVHYTGVEQGFARLYWFAIRVGNGISRRFHSCRVTLGYQSNTARKG